MASRIGNIKLTPRDLEILEVLCLKVRILSLEQIGKTWWPTNKNPLHDAARRIGILEANGHLKIHSILSHPLLALSAPIVSWRPGDKPADFAKLSYHLCLRWPSSHVHMQAVSATKKAANRFGGHGGRIPKRVEMTHDLHVGAVYLHMRQFRPHDAARWISEDEYEFRRDKAPGDKLPDAVLGNTEFPHAIEIGGKYTKQKLTEFHAWCADSGLTYEIW